MRLAADRGRPAFRARVLAQPARPVRRPTAALARARLPPLPGGAGRPVPIIDPTPPLAAGGLMIRAMWPLDASTNRTLPPVSRARRHAPPQGTIWSFPAGRCGPRSTRSGRSSAAGRLSETCASEELRSRLTRAVLQLDTTALPGRPPRREPPDSTEDRGRDAPHGAPPAQNRTSRFPAYGSHLGYLTAKRTLAACRARSSPWDMLSRLGVRRMSCSIAFPSAPPLGSTNSADSLPPLFASFIATMEGSDSSCPCIVSFGPPAFLTRTVLPQTASHEISRFPGERFHRRARASDHAGPAGRWR